ncbi:MAG: Gfo/Idh/MocA family oxidoreductase [Gemmatimonadetes bacterium]|jgi:D-xylose 1-dehydrogenase (NADP+, D-xylono-1,5-lactone-forming)|nr:Gfo/Idh/MocA family oxidoreductase [Gemmatimonadota bacterium]
MADSILRWGVMSTANIGRAAVNPAIQASSNGTLVAVASRDATRAADFASLHGIPRHHGSYEALLEDPDVDAVYIPLPNSMHRDWTIRAAQAGKHILCEKPLALSASECLEMQAAAGENNVRLMEAFMYRFHPRTQRVIEMVREGVIGDIRAIRSAFTFRLTRPDNIRLDAGLGGGALMDVGCYCVNVSRTIAGTEPVEVQAFARWADSGVDDQLTGVLRFDDDLTAHFDCSLTTERCEMFEVGGTAGHLRIPGAFLPGTADASIHEHRGRNGETEHVVPGADEYLLMVEHFADAVLSGGALHYGAEEAAANMRTIEALYASARDGGRPVTL